MDGPTAPRVPDVLGDVPARTLVAHDETAIDDARVTGEAPAAEARSVAVRGAVLDGVDLAGTRLPRAELRDCRVTGGSLANAGLPGARAERCAFHGVRLTGLTWTEGVLRDVAFHDCRIDLASFAATELQRVAFVDCVLTQSELHDARLSAVVFEDCDLGGVDLSGARFAASCTMRRCVLTDARGLERLRGVRMPYDDVLAAAPTLAAALGIVIDDG